MCGAAPVTDKGMRRRATTHGIGIIERRRLMHL